MLKCKALPLLKLCITLSRETLMTSRSSATLRTAIVRGIGRPLVAIVVIRTAMEDVDNVVDLAPTVHKDPQPELLLLGNNLSVVLGTIGVGCCPMDNASLSVSYYSVASPRWSSSPVWYPRTTSSCFHSHYFSSSHRHCCDHAHHVSHHS